MTTKRKAARAGTRAASNTADSHDFTSIDQLQGAKTKAPHVTGQCAEVLALIRHHRSLLSFILTADHAIPEAAARIHDLRAMGFHILTTIKAKVIFRGVARRNAAFYSLGSPEWPCPGFLANAEGDEQ